ncbi:MAG TPA: GNAT family acetyltransferase [Anaerolineales bacterium]|nr:GNAT family acetyltransferase [Anaerolineales bacterium]
MKSRYPAVRIRTFAMDRDYAAVVDLWRNAGEGIRLSPSDEAEEIRKKLERDADLFLVAEEGDKVVGAVLGGFDGRRGLVYHLAVDENHRRSGCGRGLMEELERRLRGRGCLKAYLLVTRDNDEAIAFYEKVGWEIMDLHVMGKPIG